MIYKDITTAKKTVGTVVNIFLCDCNNRSYILCTTNYIKHGSIAINLDCGS